MTLLRFFSGSKPQRGEDRIGGGPLGLLSDPLLDSGQALGGLMDVVAVGDIGERFEQLLETFATSKGSRRPASAASPRTHEQPRFFAFPHSSAFSRGIPAVVQSLPAAG